MSNDNITQAESLKFFPGTPRGIVLLPPSKSILHRRLIGAALAGGRSRVLGWSDSEDVQRTAAALCALGAGAERFFESFYVSGIPELFGLQADADKSGTATGTAETSAVCQVSNASAPLILECGDSASTLRFLLPLCAVLGRETVLKASPRLKERGIRVYEELFADPAYGVTLQEEADGFRIRGKLQPGEYRFRGSESSQYVSGLFFALPLLDGESRICLTDRLQSAPYAEMTRKLLAEQGILIEAEDEGVYRIPGGQRAAAGQYPVEADWSLASPFAVMNALGGQVRMKGLSQRSLQGDSCLAEKLASLCERPEEPIDLSDCPDLAPALFALAAARGEGHFVGTRRLRFKESDRVASMCEELEKFGVSCFIGEDQTDLFSQELTAPRTELDGHGDHRVVMALAALTSFTGGVIRGTQAVRKSYPAFFTDLANLKVHIETL